jgi:hypothetical protein
MKNYFILLLAILGLNCCSEPDTGKKIIRPYAENPAYWEYDGQPVLLLGGTITDNLFQTEHIESHLDSLVDSGGNYVRNTMSDRDMGDLKAYAMTADGKYDLDNWNEEYWRRFENMLKLTSERDVIVQIEVWDRFDHSRDPWLTDPYNPGNNINYTYEESGLDSVYPSHPGANLQPFFFTVPELNNNVTVLQYQEAFVKKMLSISLGYGNVLYCIDNETSGVEEWATYWAEFIKNNSNGREIYLTQMWDNWDVTSLVHKRTLDHPEKYGFIDISQNSHNPGRLNWDRAQYIFNYISGNPRPVNSTKIYGSDDHDAWLHRGMTTEHAVQTFFRNIIGGFASSRFHRPPHGLGLSGIPINSMKTIREIEELVKMWDIEPRMDLLKVSEDNTAYLAAREGEEYLLYFPKDGIVELDLAGHANKFTVQWINTGNASWGISHEIEGGSFTELRAVIENGSIAVITRK